MVYIHLRMIFRKYCKKIVFLYFILHYKKSNQIKTTLIFGMEVIFRIRKQSLIFQVNHKISV